MIKKKKLEWFSISQFKELSIYGALKKVSVIFGYTIAIVISRTKRR